MMIDTEIIDGIAYYSMSTSSVDYMLRAYDGSWELHSKRKALGRMNIGTFKFFKTIKDVESTLKVLSGISAIIPEIDKDKNEKFYDFFKEGVDIHFC